LWRLDHHACRGEEIAKYIADHPEINYYMIIDDEDDILPNQIDHFIQTNGDVGFCLADFTRFEKIYMKDLGRGGSFPDRQNKDYRRTINESM
jgi:hypothetical protein